LRLAAASAGSSIAVKMALMVMTTSGSMSVNPRGGVRRRFCILFVISGKHILHPANNRAKL
jgi:hypothetical protein